MASYRGDDLARFVLELLDHLQVRRFAIAGNSLGGEVAWRVASLAPERVQRLVLVDAAGYELKPESVPIGFRLARLPGANHLFSGCCRAASVEASVRNVVRRSGQGDAATGRPLLRDSRCAGATAALRAAVAGAGARIRQSVDANVARIRALKLPTLVIWGGRDRLIPLPTAQRFHADIAGSRLVVFDTLGHVPHEEDPAATAAAARLPERSAVTRAGATAPDRTGSARRRCDPAPTEPAIRRAAAPHHPQPASAR